MGESEEREGGVIDGVRMEGVREGGRTWVISKSISGMVIPAVSLLSTSRVKSSLLSTRRRTRVPWGGMAPPSWKGREGREGRREGGGEIWSVHINGSKRERKVGREGRWD